jgi:hypothetical protein
VTKTKAAADLVLRYLTARALFRQTPWEMPSNLEYLIARGVRLLPGGVLINEVPLAPAPAIIDDRKDRAFWSAIVGGEESAIDMPPAEQEQVRQFVIDENWTLPVMPSRRPTARDRIAAMAAALVTGRMIQKAALAISSGMRPFNVSRQMRR